MIKTPKILVAAPYLDGSDVGEAWCAFMWVKHLSKQAHVTLLTMDRPGRAPTVTQLPDVRVLSCQEPDYTLKFERLNAMAKLSYRHFLKWSRRTIRTLLANGERFDLAHQFSPIAMRYASPFAAFDIPYVLGPLGGSLETPSGFRRECRAGAWYTRLRGLDRWRLRFDPHLRKSFGRASLILGVAPYVGKLLAPVTDADFLVESELGISKLPALPVRKADKTAPVRLLHVGRGVRPKGLRDTIRALALLEGKAEVTLDVAGKGEEMAICMKLAAKLGVSHRVRFHGQIARHDVDQLYHDADIFCFPSFREPSGSVIYEAMSFALPVIGADKGGPGYVVDDQCGIKIPVTHPRQFAADIAEAVHTLVEMPALRHALGEGARLKMQKQGLWDAKIDRLLDHYQTIINHNRKPKERTLSWHRKNAKSLPSHQVVDTGSNC